MQSQKMTHISPAEWRWVFVLGGFLAALTLLPYAGALAANASSTNWQFMGILANPQDGASYLAKIAQGMRGSWLLHITHTPEPHTGAAIQVFYLMLGHLASLIGVSSLVIFHLARVVATLFMFSALYQFGAAVWTRLRPRRLFFVLVSVGSGLGWLVLLINPSINDIPDVTVPEAYPLYSAYANPHFPLAIGCLALIAALYLTVFRIDHHDDPSLTNGGLGILALTVIVALVLPQALIPFGGTLAVYVLIRAFQKRRIPVYELRWVSMFMLPAALLALYYYLVLSYNPVMALVWNGQVAAQSAPPLLVLTAYGLLFLVAVPGIVRALWHFERDGDQLMLLWLIVNFLLVFLPFNQQRRLMIGLIIPITFFTVRAIEDFWVDRIKPRLHTVALVLLIVLSVPSNVLALSIPLFGLINPEAGLNQKLLVQRGYWDAMTWLAGNGKSDDVVLAGPNVSLWIPAWGDKRVVYGHPWETIDAPTKLAEVTAWYRGEDCAGLLALYHVRYVIVGPQERALTDGGSDVCYADLPDAAIQTETFGDVTLYELAN